MDASNKLFDQTKFKQGMHTYSNRHRKMMLQKKKNSLADLPRWPCRLAGLTKQPLLLESTGERLLTVNLDLWMLYKTQIL